VGESCEALDQKTITSCVSACAKRASRCSPPLPIRSLAQHESTLSIYTFLFQNTSRARERERERESERARERESERARERESERARERESKRKRERERESPSVSLGCKNTKSEREIARKSAQSVSFVVKTREAIVFDKTLRSTS